MAEIEDVVGHQRVVRAIQANVPEIYFNGFLNALGTADVTVALERNGRPVAVLNMSFTVAKSLAAGLAQLVTAWEEAAGREIMTTHDLDVRLSKNAKAEPDQK